jgi:transcriptional regulator with XRE-family HTH domain
MNIKDERFFKDPGARVAQLRKDQALTQVQLAERLGIAQQTLAHYDVGRLRIAASMRLRLAQVLATSVEKLIDQNPGRGSGRRDPHFGFNGICSASPPPPAEQRAAMEALESMLAQPAREETRT